MKYSNYIHTHTPAKLIKTLALLFVFGVLPLLGFGTTYVATTSGGWSKAATWGGSGFPSTSTDIVTIPAGITVYIDSSAATCGTVTITGAGATLDIGNSLYGGSPQQLTVTAMFIDEGGTVLQHDDNRYSILTAANIAIGINTTTGATSSFVLNHTTNNGLQIIISGMLTLGNCSSVGSALFNYSPTLTGGTNSLTIANRTVYTNGTYTCACSGGSCPTCPTITTTANCKQTYYFVNRGAVLTNTSGTTIKCDNYIGTNGSIANSGTINLTANLTNNATITNNCGANINVSGTFSQGTSGVVRGPSVTDTYGKFTVTTTGTNSGTFGYGADGTLGGGDDDYLIYSGGTLTGNVGANTLNNSNVNATCTPTSSDASLQTIILSEGTLNVPFDPAISSYSVQLPPGTTAIPTVSAVTNNAGATFTVYQPASMSGNATIIVTAQDGSTSRYYSISFQLASVVTTGVSITSVIAQSITVGGTTALTATIAPLNADVQTVTWRSSNDSVATVSTAGAVTGQKAGTAVIYVTSTVATSITDSVTITVIPQDVITVVKTFANITDTVGKKIGGYVIANHFTGTGITYTVKSSNVAIVSTAITSVGFGLVANSAGVDTITVTATTAKGASKTLTFIVTVFAASTTSCGSIQVTGNIVAVACAGDYTGSVTLDVSGGASPYTYKWSNTRTDNRIVDMPAGTYSVLILDANACATLKTYTISEPAPIAIVDTITKPSCGISNGSINLTVSGGTNGTTIPYTYSWNNGGSTNNISNVNAGLYWVTVSDGVGCTKLKAFELSNTNAPIIILDTVVPSTCHPNNGKIVLSVIRGTAPYSFNWNDGKTNKNRIGLTAGNYVLTTTDAANCKATIVVKVPPVSFKQPEIALVTVSPSSNDNLVVWLKDTTNVINYYTVYRETNAGTFTSQLHIPFANISVFKDSTANTQSQSWRYRLSATDYCGNESPLSAVHAEYKTIHLKTVATSTNIGLKWDAYEGNNFDSYIVYRDSVAIDTVSASITQFTDNNPPKGKVSYYVGVNLVSVIIPAYIKEDIGPFSQSLSNMAESQLTSIPTDVVNAIVVYPNPASTYFVVDAQGTAQVQVYTVSGTLVISKHIAGNESIATNGLPAGLYVVKIVTGNEVVTRSLIVE